MRRQCELLDFPHSSYYYKPAITSTETLQLLNLVDRIYTDHPFLGTRKMMHCLRAEGHMVNRKRVQRLYHMLGIEAVYAKPNTSKPNIQNRVYPYLLRGIQVERPNQVYCADITYIKLQRGFMYLVAIMDWYSRYVLSWELSPSLEADFCVMVLKEVLNKQHCDIFNTDQGSQFTSKDFTGVLLDQDIKISMDGRGRAFDNIFIERLWRTIKYECVYLHEFQSVVELREALFKYIKYYNYQRFHQALKYQTPAEIYYQTLSP